MVGSNREEGGLLVKLFFYVAILIGVGYAAQRVPVGDKTAWQHVRENVRWESAREAGSDAVAAVRSFFFEPSDSVDTPNPAESSPPSKSEAQSTGAATSAVAETPRGTAGGVDAPGERLDPRSDPGERPPAEKISAADRRALDELLPR